ncbi:hypothetical protein ACIPYQ_39425 [Streptomyces sp. NPDC090045]|uniref:hypothetical protein n=1 Tax=Streptomyces sp. NPDC090045 TaxID=3365927 RepID=UPI0038000B5C
MDVVIRVQYGDPPAGLLITALGDPSGVHHRGGDLRPLAVEQDRVVWAVADRQASSYSPDRGTWQSATRLGV